MFGVCVHVCSVCVGKGPIIGTFRARLLVWESHKQEQETNDPVPPFHFLYEGRGLERLSDFPRVLQESSRG